MSKDRYELAKEQTKAKIDDAFVELLHEKSYEDITVREISERAGIGFKTFYRHYGEKILVAESIAETIWQAFSQNVVAPVDIDAVRHNVRNLLQTVLDHMEMFLALSRTPVRDNLTKTVREFGISEAIRLQMASTNSDEFQQTQRVDLITTHFLNSQMQMVIWWVENDAVLPIDELEQLIIDLVIKPIWNLNQSGN